MGHKNRDARQAAEKTAASNLQAAQVAAKANRINQYTPWGNTIYTDNGDGTWSVNQSLSPQQQNLFNQQQQVNSGLLGGIQNALSSLNYGPVNAGNIQTSLDLSGLTDYPVAPGQTAQDAIMSRLQPSLTRQRDQLRTELVNQGFNLGDQGYVQGMDEFNRQANDAYTQAGLYGINLALQQRGQQFGERLNSANYGLAAQNQQWNQAYQNANRPAMLASMLAGQYQPVQAPGAYNISVPQQATMPGANYLGALQTANQQRAANAEQKTGLLGGIGNLATGLGTLSMLLV